MAVQASASVSSWQLSKDDWLRVIDTVAVSRQLDDLEEQQLLPSRKVLYQFSARGHDVSQAMLGCLLTGSRDGVGAYYRSRPLMLSLGLSADEALASTMMRKGGMSEGRDIGVVFNLPNRHGPCVLPVCGGVGAQYTPAVGWAQAIRYHSKVLDAKDYLGSIAVAHGGDASTATNGFWSALNIATTERLPLLFYIEDNGYGISVPSTQQTPGGNIAQNLAGFQGLHIIEANASDPLATSLLLAAAVARVREGRGPVFIRVLVPRLSGHSGQDTQTYKSLEQIAGEKARDPWPKLKDQLVPVVLSEAEWQSALDRAAATVQGALGRVDARDNPNAGDIRRHLFSSQNDVPQRQGGLRAEGIAMPLGTEEAKSEGPRINFITAVRRTLEHELSVNPRVLIFGEDVGPKGGVHGVTMGLQDRFGSARVFDTSLSEEGIIGRAVGMAAAGLVPVPEIQFRKYADPAAEQLNDCGTMRWRTANRFASPMVVRIPGGFFKCGDPWHSQSNEVQWLHGLGWRVAMPSNAQDAVGLLRSALRGDDPTIFFEHRSLLDGASARRPYPGNDFVVPFGVANKLRSGEELTLVSWGAMVERCEQAAKDSGRDVELLDLRTLSPWDKDAVLASVKKTHRCLIVHEDNITAGFGAEIAAVLAHEAFFELDAPIERLAVPDIPCPHAPALLEATVPRVSDIAAKIQEMVAF
jgi:2-oxoisovalerate dehydrogenase E1 component